MSTKNQDAARKSTRSSNTKPTEKGKIKTEDKNEKQASLKPKTVKKIGSTSSSRSSGTITKTTVKKPLTNTKPNTTSSTSKVTKTQFFPTKQMYTNAIKSTQSPQSNRDRNKTRILTPNEVKILNKPTVNAAQTTNVEDYEDDFDSYESDFEAYTSSKSTSITSESDEDVPQADEERKLDSGNYELPENKHKQILDNINESNEAVGTNLTSLTDEGYEEGKSLDKNHFVNFLDAKKKYIEMRSSKLKERRGEHILSMIRLDSRYFTLFEMESESYDVFIKKFGNRNTMQISTQTGDDDACEETQTELVEIDSKWTQFPVQLTKIDVSKPNYLGFYHMELLGVGCEEIPNYEATYNNDRLVKFLLHTGHVILTLLQEKQQICTDVEVNTNKVPFSDGYVTFNTNLEIFANLMVDFVAFSQNGTTFISVHNSDCKSILCVWSVTNANYPKNILSVYGNVVCSIFGDNLIIGALQDGSIVVWDLENPTMENDAKTPSFITSIGTGHSSKVIALSYSLHDESDTKYIKQSQNSQVYSLDEEGTLIIWSVVILKNPKRQTSLSPNVRISLAETYAHFENLQCTDMIVNPLDSNHVFIATNHGHVLHCVSSGTKINPKMYTSGVFSKANCLSACPFAPLFFLSGYQNGNVVLFSRNAEKPLMVLCNKENGIQTIEWSNNKPCVFYTKDTDNNVHIWDLGLSDIFPVYSVSFKEKIDFIKLSPGSVNDDFVRRSYMLVVTERKSINLHVLNKEHGPQKREAYDKDVKKFLNYVDRL